MFKLFSKKTVPTDVKPTVDFKRRNAVLPLAIQRDVCMNNYRSWHAEEYVHTDNVEDFSPTRLYKPLHKATYYAWSDNDHVETSLKVARYHKGIVVEDPSWFSERVMPKSEREFDFTFGKKKGSKLFRKALNTYIRDEFEVQSSNLFAFPNLGGFMPCLNEADAKYVVKLLEDVCVLVFQLVHSEEKSEYTVAIINFLKLRTNGPIIMSGIHKPVIEYFEKLFAEEEVQSVTDYFVDIRSMFDQYEQVSKCAIFKKLYRFGMYVLSLSLFDKVGLSFDNFNYSKIEQEALRKKYHMGAGFVHSMLDTLTFLCQRGYQCMKTGSMDPLFHCGSSYEEWLSSANKLKRDSMVLSNPEPHGVDRFSFLANLNEAIEKGDSIAKHVYALGPFDKKLVCGILNDLKLIKSDQTTKRAAQKDRAPPFAILLFGGSSIGKTTLTNLLFFHYGKLFNLPTTSEYKYTINPASKHYNGFNSSQWCVQMDDIAYMKPSAAQAGDNSLLEMLQINNGVSFVPEQADLADKGRTPMLCRLLLSTTNTEDLNAYHYFSCSLAVRRRFPWVVDVQPKPEYTKDGCMLDSSLVPPLVEGEYPDYWLFIVKRIVPAGTERKNQQAALEVVSSFSDVYKFLQWYSNAALLHEKQQKQVLSCNDVMSSVTLCAECHIPVNHCDCAEVQARSVYQWVHGLDENDQVLNPPSEDEIRTASNLQTEIDLSFRLTKLAGGWYTSQATSWFKYFLSFIINAFAYMVLEWYFFQNWISWCYTFPIARRVLQSVLGQATDTTRISLLTIRWAGNRIRRQIGYSPLLEGIARSIVISLSSFIAVDLAMRAYWKCFAKKKKSSSKQNVQGDILPEEEIFNSLNVGRTPRPVDDERDNVWYKNDYQTTSFDVSPVSLSWKAFSREEVHKVLLKNCVAFRSHVHENGLDGIRPTKAVCVAGHIYMCNNHGLPDDGNFQMEIISQCGKDGVNSNITILVSQSDIMRYPERDVAFINIRNTPPRKDIVSLFCKPTLSGGMKGVYLTQCEDGSTMIREVDALRKHVDYNCAELQCAFDVWFGFSSEPTLNGDCGSLLVSETAFGPIILGIHVLGSPNCHAGSIVTDQLFISRAVAAFGGIVVQSNVPALSAPSAIRPLVDLHGKSPVRYLSQGTAAVYGSFAGFRGKHKSSVCPTLIRDSMVNRGYEVKYGPPVMHTWVPWHIALKDMTKPVTQLDTGILKQCTQNFISDILAGLTKEDLAQVHVYDLVTAVNGAPGVAYVDKMNRNTSMGNPWKKGKKYFMNPIAPIGDLSDPVELTPEITDRVDTCISNYVAGMRYHPVFCGHLKDEGTKFSKIESGKTRVFTGAPGDWSVTVRMYLLSVIRLIQNNRFLFGSAPGTVAQSTEWGKIREYLIAHGADQLMAGDYASFDKSMPPTMILAAFDILLAICKAAGYTEAELRVVAGIAEDTAFPLVDFNGDLIEFYGSNPSGHPLTVIINGLANVLYMRYCYAKLSPEGNCLTFMEFVNIMTYGDDNAMGISKKISNWYNHTTIKNALQDIGIKYTMADKEAESIPLINIKDVSFLKRTWRFDEDVGAYLCPLEHDSIEKMLTTCVRSKTITQEEQSVAVIATALREYFFYGQTTFLTKSKLLKEVCDENDLGLYVQETTFPTWESLKDDFWRNSK